MEFAEVELVVEGIMEEARVFTDETLFNQYFDQVEEDANDHGYETEVYVVWHEHRLEVDDCGCVQYQTDIRPFRSFNIRG